MSDTALADESPRSLEQFALEQRSVYDASHDKISNLQASLDTARRVAEKERIRSRRLERELESARKKIAESGANGDGSSCPGSAQSRRCKSVGRTSVAGSPGAEDKENIDTTNDTVLRLQREISALNAKNQEQRRNKIESETREEEQRRKIERLEEHLERQRERSQRDLEMATLKGNRTARALRNDIRLLENRVQQLSLSTPYTTTGNVVSSSPESETVPPTRIPGHKSVGSGNGVGSGGGTTSIMESERQGDQHVESGGKQFTFSAFDDEGDGVTPSSLTPAQVRQRSGSRSGGVTPNGSSADRRHPPLFVRKTTRSAYGSVATPTKQPIFTQHKQFPKQELLRPDSDIVGDVDGIDV